MECRSVPIGADPAPMLDDVNVPNGQASLWARQGPPREVSYYMTHVGRDTLTSGLQAPPQRPLVLTSLLSHLWLHGLYGRRMPPKNSGDAQLSRSSCRMALLTPAAAMLLLLLLAGRLRKSALARPPPARPLPPRMSSLAVEVMARRAPAPAGTVHHAAEVGTVPLLLLWWWSPAVRPEVEATVVGAGACEVAAGVGARAVAAGASSAAFDRACIRTLSASGREITRPSSCCGTAGSRSAQQQQRARQPLNQ